MANGSSSQGQLQRAGVSRLISDKRGKRRKKMIASRRIHESNSEAFTEKGQDEKPQGKAPKSRVYLVTIIEEGLGNSKDKNYYSGQALQGAPALFNGAKAFCDHPDAISEKTLPERSMKDVVGWYTDCFTDKNPQTGKVRLRGKLHIFPDAKWLSDKIDTILTDPTAKNLFGISINAIGKTRPATMDGEEVNFVEEFQRVDSADVVTEPAARGKFDQMLESRRSSSGSKVSGSMRRRTREAAVLSSEKAKEVADSLVSAYNSDNPDEAKQAMFEAAKVLHAASSISGKGPGQVNEEQYSNINPSGGAEMAKQRTRASAARPLRFRKKKALKAAAGTGPDNEDEGEPGESDLDSNIREADVEDEEGKGDLGDQDNYGGGRSYRDVKASAGRPAPRRRVAVAQEDEDEGFEDEAFEDEAFEDEGAEDEDENVGQMPGGAATPGSAPAAPAGGGAPGSSRSVASAEAGDGESESDDESDDGESDDDLDDMDEAEDEHEMMRPGNVAEAGRSRRRRSHEAEASFSGGLGSAGHKALPKEVDDTRGYTDRDEDWGKEDSSTSGVGKSYKIKTSRFARNRKARSLVKPVVREANRRIEFLTQQVTRLRESLRAKDRKVEHFRGKIRLMESGRSATSLLREAVSKEILPKGVAGDLYPRLLGLSRDEQIREIKSTARFLESAQEGVVSRLTESVDGNGARGSVVSWGTAGADDSVLVEGLAGDGIPMKQEEQ